VSVNYVNNTKNPLIRSKRILTSGDFCVNLHIYTERMILLKYLKI